MGFVINPYVFASTGVTLFTDDFNRSDSTNLGADWLEEEGTAAEISGSQLRSVTDLAEVFYASELASVNHYVEVDITNINSSNGTVMLYARTNGESSANGMTGYAARFSHHTGGPWQIFRVVSGAYTVVASTAGSRTIPYRMRLEVQDESGDVRINLYDSTSGDVLKVTYLDTSGSKITTGKRVGLRLDHFATGAVWVDNFETGVL